MKPWLAVALCAVALGGCKNNSSNVALASLNRSAKMQLFCADVEQVTGSVYDVAQVLPIAPGCVAVAAQPAIVTSDTATLTSFDGLYRKAAAGIAPL